MTEINKQAWVQLVDEMDGHHAFDFFTQYGVMGRMYANPDRESFALYIPDDDGNLGRGIEVPAIAAKMIRDCSRQT